MTFIKSAENVRVDEGHILRAQLRNVNGDLEDAEIDLDRFIGNNYGMVTKKLLPISCKA
jgi:CVNH domain